MWHQAGARGMHRKLRAEGRVPGAEGRAKIEENRQRRAEEKRQATIAALSSVTAGEKGRDGLTKEQREANEMILAAADERNRQHAEECQARHAANLKRWNSPTPLNDGLSRVGRIYHMDYI